jgi:hypothetical protein
MIGKSSTPRQCHKNPDKPESWYTWGTQAEILYRNPEDSGRASALEQTRAEKSCRSLNDSGRASTLELRGGLPICWEALRPSEPHHSSDKAMPSYYTKKESFASGISKMWCVCVSTFTTRGVFIGPWGSSIDLAEAVTHQMAISQPSHMADRQVSLASTDFLNRP